MSPPDPTPPSSGPRPAPRDLFAEVRALLKHESASGILLLIAGAAGLLAANSVLAPTYDALLDTPLKIQVGQGFTLDKSLLVWINELLMAVFFLHVGLELKRDVLFGEVSDRASLSFPAFAALGGMLVPAMIYAAINLHDPVAIRGWAIPSATDIAFALGVLSLFGPRVPPALKVLLTSIAVLDDLGAIVIIALFYTSELSATALAVALAAVLGLVALNRSRVRTVGPYLLVGLVLWVCVLKSGVHATLAGVITALFVPSSDPAQPETPPLVRLHHALQPWVVFGILPLFAFANAGVHIAALGPRDLLHPITLGIALGLFVGKPLGVFTLAWLAVRTGLAQLPAGVTNPQVFGVALLCGIGFTMSLFIGMLAFETGEPVVSDRVGILVGTALSAVVGFAVLHATLPRPAATESSQ